MHQRTLGLLIALNVGLVFALGSTFLMPTKSAEAQAFGAKRNFTMISGKATGRAQNSVIYVIDANSGDMVAGFFNSAINQFEGIGGRAVADDMRAAQ